MKLPVKVPTSFRIIAHRGASGYAPENTMAAFQLAEKMGVSEVELDVQFSKDHQLVLCHDLILDRYGYPGIRVADLTLDELLKLDMGSWYSPFLYGGEPLLSLETLFDTFGDHFVYHVELKATVEGITQAVAKTVTANRLQERAIITSFHLEALSEIKELAPDLRIGWLIKNNAFSREKVTRAIDAGVFQICPPANETNKEKVSAARSSIPEVRAHSVKGITDMLQAIEAGCDGMTVNWPDWLVHE
ncbi:MAG: hypothetical protein GTO14_21665 [Anaerolineales bacterium]|nr:hypothetical protein [Anaerolineales bacterium]